MTTTVDPPADPGTTPAAAPTPATPAATAAPVVLRDRTTVTVRPMHDDDGGRLVAFHAHLSTESQRLRFFTAHPRLSDEEVDRFTHVDGHARVALVAERDGEIVAVGRYDRLDGGEAAEVAFVVRDDLQGRGLCGVLLDRLADLARAEGIVRLVADTLPENTRMIHAFRRAGPDVSIHMVDGVVEVVVPL
ncbi:MAG TPA: GNAT family N-acetyltransferase [Acidimicrobiales bacterium]